jgi:hypothetical protein
MMTADHSPISKSMQKKVLKKWDKHRGSEGGME